MLKPAAVAFSGASDSDDLDIEQRVGPADSDSVPIVKQSRCHTGITAALDCGSSHHTRVHTPSGSNNADHDDVCGSDSSDDSDRHLSMRHSSSSNHNTRDSDSCNSLSLQEILMLRHMQSVGLVEMICPYGE